MTPKRIVQIVLAVVATIVLFISIDQAVVTVNADEVVVKQGAFDGKLTVWTDPGIHCQCFGNITRYKRSAQYWFSTPKKDDPNQKGEKFDEPVKVRFNDGGHGTISGSLRYDLPLDVDHIVLLHRTFHSLGSLDHDLVRQVVTKSIYMTGPLMSSKESYAERRTDILNYVSDQVSHGVYRTRSEPVKGIDPVTGQEKTVLITKIVEKVGAPGGLDREELSPMEKYGLTVSNVTLNSIDYDTEVESQIKTQQKAIMDVQTAQADSRKAEQRALTAEQEGKAKAAEARWSQEVEKAKAVTAAEQARDVAKLGLEAAQLTKQTDIAIGEGEAKRKQLVMSADGALEQKIAAWKEVQLAYADKFGQQRWVPEIQIGQNSSQNSATGLMDLLQASAARQLGLDVGINLKGAAKK